MYCNQPQLDLMKKPASRFPFLLKKTGFVLIFFCLVGSISAQLNTPGEIDRHHQELSQVLENCSEEEPCGYYLNQVVHNAKSDPWPAVGIFRSFQNFWYEADETGEGRISKLVKIKIVTERSARIEQETFLFNDEQALVYYRFKMGETGEVGQDLVFYFSNGKVIDYRENVSDEEKDYQQWTREDAPRIIGVTKKLESLFRMTVE